MDMQAREQQIQAVLEKCEQLLKTLPVGRLSAEKDRYRYYGPDGSQHLLSPDQDANLIQQLAQKQYLEKTAQTAEREYKGCLAYLRKCGGASFESVYYQLPPKRQQWVRPIFLPEYTAQNWMQASYFQKDAAGASFPCSSGILVRSKSEALIASRLQYFCIPFHYEERRILEPVGEVYPDFTLISPRTNQICIWEHFGKMDDQNYALRTVQKLLLYRANGYILGKNFLFTMESLEHPLTPKEIDNIILANLMDGS